MKNGESHRKHTLPLSPTYRFINQNIELGTFAEVNCCFWLEMLVSEIIIYSNGTDSFTQKKMRNANINWWCCFPTGVVNLYPHTCRTVKKLLLKEDGQKENGSAPFAHGVPGHRDHNRKQSVVGMLCMAQYSSKHSQNEYIRFQRESENFKEIQTVECEKRKRKGPSWMEKWERVEKVESLLTRRRRRRHAPEEKNWR